MGIWVRSGQVSIENGSNVVTGTLTTFGVSVAPGNPIYINGGTRAYEVAALDAITPNTKLTLTENFGEASVVNGTYAIIPFLGDRTPIAVNLLKQHAALIAGQTDVIETVGAPDPTIAATNLTGKLIAFDAANSAYYYTQDGVWQGPVALGGADGADAGFKLEFDTGILTNVDPGTGIFRFNNATKTAITQISIDNVSADLGNPDISAYIATWAQSSSGIKGTLILRGVGQPNKFAIFALNSISVQSGYTQLNVTHIASTGTFTDAGDFSLAFIRNGDKGDAGSAGLNAGFLITLDRATITMVDPTSGKMKFDSASFATTNNIAIDDTSADAGNPSIAALIATWARSTNGIKGQLRIAKVGAGNNYAVFDLMSVTAQSGWTQLGVAFDASGGTLMTGDVCSVAFAQAGNKGIDGVNGWTAIFATATDGDRRVLQVSDWTGGSGTKPATGKYLGSAGFVDAIADGVDIRGAGGLQGDPGTNFDPDARGLFSERSAYDTQAEGFCFLSIDGDGDTITTAVLFFKNSATSGDWSDATPFQGRPGDPGTTDYNALSNKPTLGTSSPLDIDADGTLAANSDSKIATQKAVKTALGTKINSSALDTDGTLAANSDTRVASQKAIRTYLDARIAALDVVEIKGGIDCSASPNYPAADAGALYKVTVAGKIGGAMGTNVEAGDTLFCFVDGSVSGNQATVGTNWIIVQVNLDGAVIGPAAATDGNIVLFDGPVGKKIRDSGVSYSVLNARINAPTIQILTSSGTWTKPAGCVKIKATIVGAGGGGGGCASTSGSQSSVGVSAHAGAACVTWLDVTSISSLPVTVGAAGAGGAAGNNDGTAGGASSLGTAGAFGTANGGPGGTGGAASTVTNAVPNQSAAATATGGTFNFPGATCGFGYRAPSVNTGFSAPGAPSIFGGGGASGINSTSKPGGAPGAGGSGGGAGNSGSATAGGNGGAGIVIIEEFYA